MTLYIAGWIANLLVLGIALIIWLIGIFGTCLILSMIKDLVERLTHGGDK